MQRANEDRSCRLWVSLAEVLPLLAEAAPDTFLDGVRDGLGGHPPLLVGMFMDADADAFSASSAHTGLLWALEAVAWSSDHFGQAVDLLARLTEIDPGGRLSNRPDESLARIFCPWHPENAVKVVRRLSAIDGLRDRHSSVSWPLMLTLLPEFQAVHFPTHEPEYRDWKPQRSPVTVQEYLAFIDEIVRRLLEDAGASPERWRSLIDQITHLPPPSRTQVREQLARLVHQAQFSATGREQIWEALRALVAQHRAFPDADWALPTEEVDLLDALTQRLVPEAAAARHAWLFNDHMPELDDFPQRDNWEAYEGVLSERRRDAVVEVETAAGLDGVKTFARDVSLPWAVGIALADGAIGKYDPDLLSLLQSDNDAAVQLASAYVTRRFMQDGWPWVEALLSGGPTLTALQRARLLVQTGDFPRAWEVADEQGRDVAEAFWSLFRTYGLGADFAHVAYAAERLLSVGRAAAALDLIGLYLRRDQGNDGRVAESAIAALEALLAQGDDAPEAQALSQHDFEELFSSLQRFKDEVGWERIARLEWAFLPALGVEARAQTLHQLMADDPSFFVQIVETVFRPNSSEEPADDSPEKQRRGQNGYRLLSTWRRVPGTGADGTLSGPDLRRWATEALRLLAEADRLEVGELHIGQVLASSPADPDESWPCTEVRDLLEELQNERVESGLFTGILKRRGVTTRSPGEGGGQERELAEKYRNQADQFADRWPRTASILRRLAHNYEHDARREDASAERFRRGLER
jgi:hypothetical protein